MICPAELTLTLLLQENSAPSLAVVTPFEIAAIRDLIRAAQRPDQSAQPRQR
jgi:hypothetical protein